jgi:hypothetical protein
LVPTSVVHVWYLAIVSLAERTAREDVRRCEAGGFGDAVEEQYLVGRRDHENTLVGEYNVWPQQGQHMGEALHTSRWVVVQGVPLVPV